MEKKKKKKREKKKKRTPPQTPQLDRYRHLHGLHPHNGLATPLKTVAATLRAAVLTGSTVHVKGLRRLCRQRHGEAGRSQKLCDCQARKVISHM